MKHTNEYARMVVRRGNHSDLKQFPRYVQHSEFLFIIHQSRRLGESGEHFFFLFLFIERPSRKPFFFVCSLSSRPRGNDDSRLLHRVHRILYGLAFRMDGCERNHHRKARFRSLRREGTQRWRRRRRQWWRFRRRREPHQTCFRIARTWSW